MRLPEQLTVVMHTGLQLAQHHFPNDLLGTGPGFLRVYLHWKLRSEVMRADHPPRTSSSISTDSHPDTFVDVVVAMKLPFPKQLWKLIDSSRGVPFVSHLPFLFLKIGSN